ncbi:MAG: hypothetical protein HN348_02330, partial [Proteobacteria bacterium]|nr:hypothetical protein [Pseudomonadota bacterium]
MMTAAWMFLVACTGITLEEEGKELPDGPLAIVATTDYSVGAIAAVSLDDWTIFDSIRVSGGDPMVVVEDGVLYQANRSGGDSVRLYPRLDEAPTLEVPLTDGANAQDIAIINDEAFVTQYDLAEMASFNIKSGLSGDEVELLSYAESDDGLPEMVDIIVVDGLLYVGLQRLKRLEEWVSYEGRIVAIDPASHQVVDEWVVGPNPRIFAHPWQSHSLVVLTGLWDETVGAFSVLDLGTGEITDLATEADLGVHLSLYGEDAHGHALLVGGDIEGEHKLFCWDWASLTMTTALSTSAYLRDLQVNSRGEAYLAIRGWNASDDESGVMVFDVAACTELTDEWLSFELPPY